MASLDQYFSVLALFILFRETIEASIICGVLLQFLNRAKPSLKRAVWWGVVGGVVVSIIFGVIFISVYYTAQNNLFKGKNRDWFKGIISWVAALLITILAFAMLRFLGWEEKWKRRLTEKMAKKLPDASAKDAALAGDAAATASGGKDSLVALRDTTSTINSEAAAMSKSDAGASSSAPAPHKSEQQQQQQAALATVSSSSGSGQPDAKAGALADDKLGLAAADSGDVEAPAVVDDDGADLTPPTRKEFWNIWILVFTTVVREGIESVVFLGGLNGTKLSAIPLPAVVGITAGCLVGIFLYYSGKQVKHIKWLVIGMAIIIFFIAAGQVNLGTDALMRAGMFGECSPWYDERPWIMVPLYDWSNCCSDIDPIGTEPTGEQNRRRFFSLARAIFGYQDKGTPLEIIIYTCYWSLVLLIAAYKSWRGTLFDADYKHTRTQRRLAKEAARRAATEAQLEEEAAAAVALIEAGAGAQEGAGRVELEGGQAQAGGACAPDVLVSVGGGPGGAVAPVPAQPKLGPSS